MRVGSLFTGYGGLDMAINGDLAWYAEIEPAACRVLEAHHPGVPNLGDITKINWDEVEPVDVITGGYPCQPFSTAGHRKGRNDERHLWPYVHTAIRTLRPDIAIMENVAGHLSLGFADVLADLAAIGWDAEWTTVRASDVGACHRRARLFILAYSSSAERRDTEHEHLCEAVRPATESGERVSFTADTCSGPFTRPPAERDGLPVATERSHSTDWGQYTQAIRRWADIIGRPAPAPTFIGPTGRPRLNPVFVEWMMGLPEGHVTGHGLSAAQCLKMLGNGVVPQQAAHAIQHLTKRGTQCN
jgi:DNA (cytosine-5)-methyltransferase 1